MAHLQTPHAADQSSDYALQVRYNEVGHDGLATLGSLANWLQEAANINAAALGFGEYEMTTLGVTWILTRLVLRIRRLPGPGEHVRVHTWPSTLDRFGHRGYEVYDGQGQRIVSGGSAWSVMNMATRRLVAAPPELASVYPAHPAPCLPFTCRNLPRLPQEPDPHPPAEDAGHGSDMRGVVLRVRRQDLDINGHVNNAHYLSWLLEPLPLPPAGSTAQVPRLVDLSFRMECFPGDELASLCACGEKAPDQPENAPAPLPSDGVAPDGQADDDADKEVFRLVHAIRARRSHDGMPKREDVCRAVTLWDHNPLAS